MANLLDALCIFFQVLVGLIGIYQVFLGIAGFFLKKEECKQPIEKSFAILVAAHNEERVIGSLLDNLQHLSYPKELYEVFVICDNCTDKTADIVRAHHLQPMERTDALKRGKGHAIEWMLEQLWLQDRHFDGVIILDADNLVSENFLIEMNEKLMNGSKVVQAYLETKNPYDSWVSLSYAIMYWFMNRVWQLARYNLKVANILGGTGMCIETSLLKEIGWGANSLTEDVEFTARCVQREIYPTWAHYAIVYDEKPITLWSSMRQRLRWMQGHIYCARQYFWKLLWISLKNRNWSQFDAAIYLFQPFRFLIYISYLFMLYFQVGTSLINQLHITEILPNWFIISVSIVLYLQAPMMMFLEKKPFKAYLGYFPYLVFSFTWIPVTIYAFFTSNNRKWSHTVHTRSIKIDEISK